ncbi:MAG: hypothetical protein LBD93_10555 [Treponema sp.]|jgi:hypothetical protein|nr:hypothetical protein [Treponema sp.]
MRNITLFVLVFTGLVVHVFGQSQANAGIVRSWKHDKEGLTFQFKADSTFAMGEEGEAARRAIEQEQRSRGESATASVSGTYTVNGSRIEMLMVVDGKTHKVRMSWKLIDANTLRLDGQNYRKEQNDD